MNEHDKQEIEKLKRFAIIVLQKRIEEVDLSYEEKIKRHIASLRGESNVSKVGK